MKTEECEKRGRKVRQRKDMGVVWVQGNPRRGGAGQGERRVVFNQSDKNWSEARTSSGCLQNILLGGSEREICSWKQEPCSTGDERDAAPVLLVL